MYVVVSYDIRSDKRRTKVHDMLQNYGYRVQFSVFECDVKKQEFAELQARLEELIDPEADDSVRYYELCASCQRKIGRRGGITPQKKGAIIV